jgi:hypothetical protein
MLNLRHQPELINYIFELVVMLSHLDDIFSMLLVSTFRISSQNLCVSRATARRSYGSKAITSTITFPLT